MKWMRRGNAEPKPENTMEIIVGRGGTGASGGGASVKPERSREHQDEADKALVEKWAREWAEAKDAAIAALGPEEEKYHLWQDRDTGMWRVGERRTKHYPDNMWGRSAKPSAAPERPDMKVLAWRETHPYEPTFRTAAEARKWLLAGLNPKVLRFDAAGNELPTLSDQPATRTNHQSE